MEFIYKKYSYVLIVASLFTLQCVAMEGDRPLLSQAALGFCLDGGAVVAIAAPHGITAPSTPPPAESPKKAPSLNGSRKNKKAKGSLQFQASIEMLRALMAQDIKKAEAKRKKKVLMSLR